MRRQFFIVAVACFLLIGSLTAAFATQNDRDYRLRGYVDAAQSHALPFRIPRLGVNADLTLYDQPRLEDHLDLMQSMSANWIRQIVRWEAIEPISGTMDWSEWDRITATVAEFEALQILPVFYTAPAWASADFVPDHPTTPPADPAAFAAFAGAFAARYGDSIRYYQVWDEPNLSSAWGNLPANAAAYAALLSAAYTAIHAADPDSVVIAAALAPTTEVGRNISDIVYLEQLYALGADAYADAFAAKPYGFNTSPEDRRVDADVLNFSRVVALREVMTARGNDQTPLWISEFGWNALPENWTGSPSIWGHVTREQQVDYTQAALYRADREWAWLGGMILADWQPNVPFDNPRWGFALLNSDDNPTPLFELLRTTPPAPFASNGLYRAVNPYASYSGVWTFGELGADIGWLNDSQLAFEFTGRDVSLILRQGDYVAFLYPTVDDQPANALPRDAVGSPFINLKSDDRLPGVEIVPTGRNLPDGDHVLRAAADRGWDQWALVGYAVGSGDLAQPYQQQITLAFITSAIAALAMVVSAAQIAWKPILARLTVLVRTLTLAQHIVLSVITSLALMVGMLLTWGNAVPAIFRREPVQLGLAVLSGGLIYLELHIIVTVLAVAALFVLIFHRLDLGLMLTILFAPFFLFPVELYRFAFPMSELILLITTVAAVVRGAMWWGERRQSAAPQSIDLKSMTMLDWAVVAWGVLGVISLVWADNRSAASTELRTIILEPIAFYVILRARRPTHETLLRLVDTLVIAGVIVSVVGVFLFVRGEALITAEGGAARLASVYGSPNNVALFIGRCLPFALAFTLIKTDRTRRRLAGAALLIMGAAAALTLSAGALFIGIPAALIVVLLLIGGRRAWLPIGALIGGGAVLALIATRFERFARLLDLTGGTNFFRVRVWQSAAQIITERPITGLGLDQFLYAFRGRYMLPDAWQEPNLSHPHNILLDFWTRLGLFGVMLIVWIQIEFWRRAVRLYSAYRTHSNRLTFALIVGAMGSMVNLIAHGLVDNSVFVNDLAYIFILLIALIASLTNIRAIDAKAEKMV